MSHELTKLEERELHSLATRINDREETIGQLRGKTEDHARQTVAEAILQGQDLIKAKATVPHGAWLDWLAAHCPKVEPRMAQRYMKVAMNTSRVVNASSLREALLLCEENEGGEPKGPAKKTPEDLQALYLFTRATKFITAHPLDRCPPETLDEMRKELEPTAKALWPERWECDAA